MPGPVTISTHKKQIGIALDELYHEANLKYIEQAKGQSINWVLSEELISLIDTFWAKGSGSADSAITNLTTCLIAKAVEPAIDCRYHREPKGEMAEPPTGSTHFVTT